MTRIADPPNRLVGLLGIACGIAAPVVYAGTVAWGATLFPGYNHVADFISELTQSGRIGTEPIELLFGLYNALVLAFALTSLRMARGHVEWTISFVLLFAVGVAGILMWPFPQDPVGAPVTPRGLTHIVLAALEALGSMAAIGFAALAWRRTPDGEDMAIFSTACLAIVFASGLLGAAGAVGGWTVTGLLERVTIGFFLLWMLVTAAVLLRRSGALSHSVAGTRRKT